jgi:aryl carrier-like protein
MHPDLVLGIYSACREVTDTNTPAENFGLAVGSNHWIVDPADSNRLMPIGAVGEIITEGPIVAREYFNNPDATDDAFVGFRSWSSYSPGSDSPRYYKTGDLGRYNDDGSINFVARKDNQVKVRGQRMELQDVEHQLSRLPQVGHTVVALPDAGPFAKQLVATVTLKGETHLQIHTTALSLLSPSESLTQTIHDLQDVLASRLPMYMVPTVWVTLEDLPRTVNGKLDRVRIKRWLNHASDEIAKTVSQYLQADGADQPVTETEKKIQQVWADVLNLPQERISNSSSFLRLGGDSITAMTVLARCRQINMFLTVQDILRSKSLSQLAASAKHDLKPITMQQEQLNTPFELGPIQKMHFHRTGNGKERFHQGFYLKLRRHLSPYELDKALESVVLRHTALRTRFWKTADGHWTQSTHSNTERHYALVHKHTSSQEEREVIVSQIQSQIDIVKGPLMAVALFDTVDEEGTQYLFITAHHLVVDLVSWRIILEDLEEVLERGKISSHQSTGLQTWLSLQKQHVTSAQIAICTPEESISVADYAYWGLEDSENRYRDAIKESFILSRDQTLVLLNKCHDPLRTEPIDLLMTAVLFAFGQTFADRRGWPTIYNEGHGREPWDPSIDLTRTVGWFTSIFPITIANDTPRDIISILRRVKDARHAFSGAKGSDYLASQFGGEFNSKKPRPLTFPEIIFNYAGVYQQLEKEQGLFTSTGGIDMDDVDLDLKRFSLFNVEMAVENGELHCTLVYHRRIKQLDQITTWIANCKTALESLIEKLPTHPPLPTLSNFSSTELEYADLEYLVDHTLRKLQVPSVDSVEDYLPCSPMQNYMMNIEDRMPGFVNCYFFFEITPGDGSRVDFNRLRHAWQTVVDRNPILRTIFVLNQEGKRMQLILKHVTAPIEKIVWDDSISLEEMEKSAPIPYEANKVHSRLSYFEATDGRSFCCLDISHNLSDASSRDPLFAELSAAYDNCVRSTLPRSYVSAALEMESLHHDSYDFWEEYVADIFPSHLHVTLDSTQPSLLNGKVIVPTPSYADLKQRCASAGVTMGNLLHAAWEILLHHETKATKVCFNYLTAGRDARVFDINTVIGPCFNTLLAKAEVSPHQSLDQVLHNAREDFLETLPHHGLPIVALEKHGLGSFENICNTSVNFRKFGKADEDKFLKPGQTRIEEIGGKGQLGVRKSFQVFSSINVVATANCGNSTPLVSTWRSDVMGCIF